MEVNVDGVKRQEVPTGDFKNQVKKQISIRTNKVKSGRIGKHITNETGCCQKDITRP